MYVLIFSTTLVWNIFHSRRYRHYYTYALVKSTCYFWQSIRKCEFCRQIFEKSSNIKFHENPSSGSGQTEGQMDGQTIMTNLIVTFHNFSNAPNKMETYAWRHRCGRFPLLYLIAWWETRLYFNKVTVVATFSILV